MINLCQNKTSKVIHRLLNSFFGKFLLKYYANISIVLIILGGFLLRVWQLGKQSLWIDEGFSINAAQAILKHGYPLLDSGKIYGGSFLHTYVIAFFIKIFGLDPFNPWSARIASIIFGTLLIFLIYKLTLGLFKNKYIALFSAFLIAFSAWEIAWSRQARMYIFVQFFFFGSLYEFWLWLKTYNKKNLIYFLLFALGAFSSHLFGFFLIPIFLLLFVFSQILFPEKRIIWKQRINLKDKNNLIILIIFSCGIWLSSQPIIKFLSKVLSKDSFYDFTPLYVNFLFNDLKLFTLTTIIALVLGFSYELFSKKYFWQIIFISTSLLFPLIIVINYTPVCQMRYIFPIFPLMIIFLNYLILRSSKLLAKFINPNLTILILFLLCILVFQHSLNFLPKSNYPLEFGSPQPNFKQAYAIIKNERSDTDIIISPYAHLTNIYLEEKGYYLPISLTGRSGDIGIVNEKYDYYVNAPIIENSEHLKNLIETKTGFIVLDSMSINRRLSPEIITFLRTHLKIKLIYYSDEGSLNKIWLLRF